MPFLGAGRPFTGGLIGWVLIGCAFFMGRAPPLIPIPTFDIVFPLLINISIKLNYF